MKVRKNICIMLIRSHLKKGDVIISQKDQSRYVSVMSVYLRVYIVSTRGMPYFAE
mgnify:CR=1 FL=1